MEHAVLRTRDRVYAAERGLKTLSTMTAEVTERRVTVEKWVTHNRLLEAQKRS